MPARDELDRPSTIGATVHFRDIDPGQSRVTCRAAIVIDRAEGPDERLTRLRLRILRPTNDVGQVTVGQYDGEGWVDHDLYGHGNDFAPWHPGLWHAPQLWCRPEPVEPAPAVTSAALDPIP